ncbi:hypothetical protein [Haloplanus salilacus]|uniref:hypothetical protein n=1 Tax=Haloplanus salilacus TaxID=2949994 RepID=UPI0030D00F4E
MTSSSRLPSIPLSAYGLFLALSTALWVRSVAAASSHDPTPTALLTGRPPMSPVLAVGGVGLALLLAATVIGLALLTARAA